ncbi:alpha/beta fold hydrolase [Arenimonas sp.]|uniref:alpha/beta hydrolase family protein n=1 Tax=Arenimonas sp. TaxID=1872635 RepID=UPI0035AF87F7
MPLEESKLQAPDGHAFVLRRWCPQDARGGLLFLPALGVPANKYDGFAQALNRHGVAVAVPDWRGTGSSDWRAARDRDWGYAHLLEQDLPTALDALPTDLPWSLGGHSLGGQFAGLLAARRPDRCAGLALVATGVPDWRSYRGGKRWGIAGFAHALPVITHLVGHYPGDRLGFAGREAGGLMRDWSRTVRRGCYADYGESTNLEAAMARLSCPMLGVHFEHDALVPEATLHQLLEKLGPGPRCIERFDAARLGTQADHFRWMREPGAVAAAVAEWLPVSP